MLIIWRLWLMRCNAKKRQAIADQNMTIEEVEKRGQELGAEDITDMRNPYFL